MIASLVFLYTISVFLVLAASLQRTKHEETLKETNVLFLAICTFFSLILLYVLRIIIDHKVLSTIALIIYVPIGYYSTVSNLYYFFQFGELEIEEELYQIQPSQSEYSEILVNNDDEIGTEKIDYKKSPYELLMNSIRYFWDIIYFITLLDLSIYVFSLIFILSYLWTKNWLLTNCVSSSICFCTIREIRIYSIIAGYTLFLVLFVYDVLYIIFQSFYNVLVEDIDNPIRIIFPINFKRFDLIGFGDIITAAAFLALVRRYCDDKHKQNLFIWSFIGFCVSVGIIISYNCIVKDEVPPMLVISPIISIFSMLSALISYDFKEYIQYVRVKTKNPDVELEV